MSALLDPRGKRGFEPFRARAVFVDSERILDGELALGTFLSRHLHTFEIFSGVPRHCLYDTTKVVVTSLDFALRVGFDARLR